jgi:hypothetical protein
VTVAAWLLVLMMWAGASALALLVSLLVTSPQAIGPVGVTLWFVVLYTFMAAVAALAGYAAKTFLRLHATDAARLRYSWRQGMLVGGWLTALLAFSSLHQLNLLDAILLALLLGIVEVYVRFRWP